MYKPMTKEEAICLVETWINGNRNWVMSQLHNKRDLAMVILAFINQGKPREGVELLKKICERE